VDRAREGSLAHEDGHGLHMRTDLAHEIDLPQDGGFSSQFSSLRRIWIMRTDLAHESDLAQDGGFSSRFSSLRRTWIMRKDLTHESDLAHEG
jgi:hypothetical protein